MTGKHTKKKRNVMWVVLAILICLIAGIVIVHFSNRGQEVENQEISVDGESSTSIYEQADSTPEYITINTDYGDLYYPEQWNEYVATEESWNDESLTVSFSAQINDAVYPMFQVTIGESDETEVGELTDSSGTKRTVYMSVTELENIDELTDSEKNRLYAMQEDLNYLIDNLK